MNYYKRQLDAVAYDRGAFKCFHDGNNIYYFTDYDLIYHFGTYTLVLYFGEELVTYLTEPTIERICKGESKND